MDIRDLKDYLDGRLDKIDNKLDVHLERLAKVETEVANQKGTVKLIISILITSVGGLLSLVYKKLFSN